MTTKAQPVSRTSANRRRNQITILGIVIVIAMVAFAIVILFSTQTKAVDLKQYDNIPQSRLADGGFVIGNTNAPVTLVEFVDYACPVCQAYQPVMDQFFNEYVKTGKAKYEYRIFPTHGRETTQFNGQIAVCLEEQKAGSFWLARDLFVQDAPGGNYIPNSAQDVTKKLRLDYAQALACQATQKQVDTDVALGERLGVNGTPAVMLRVGNADPHYLSGYTEGGPPYAVIATVLAAEGVR